MIESDEEFSGGNEEDEIMREATVEEQKPVAKKMRRAPSTPSDRMEVDPDASMDVDIDGSDIPQRAASSSKPAKRKRRRSAAAFSSGDDGDDGNPVGGDDDDDDFREAKTQLSDDDFDANLPRARSKPVRAKIATWKVRDSEEALSNRKTTKKNASAAKSAKGKAAAAKKDKEKEVISVKDERKPIEALSTNAPPKLSRSQSASKQIKQRAKSQTKEDVRDEDAPVDIFDEPVPLPSAKDEGPSTSALASTPATAPAVPPKKKLPTIRKNKPVASGSGSGTPVLASVPGKPDIKPLGIAIPRVPATSDFDLRDAGAWASIFKQVRLHIQSIRYHIINSIDIAGQLYTALWLKPEGEGGRETKRAIQNAR